MNAPALSSDPHFRSCEGELLSLSGRSQVFGSLVVQVRAKARIIPSRKPQREKGPSEGPSVKFDGTVPKSASGGGTHGRAASARRAAR